MLKTKMQGPKKRRRTLHENVTDRCTPSLAQHSQVSGLRELLECRLCVGGSHRSCRAAILARPCRQVAHPTEHPRVCGHLPSGPWKSFWLTVFACMALTGCLPRPQPMSVPGASLCNLPGRRSGRNSHLPRLVNIRCKYCPEENV